MSVRALQEAVSNSPKDDFENGTVVRWVSGGIYQYAAVKTPIGWSTTARTGNTHIPQLLDFAGLLEVLARSETSEVFVSKLWMPIQ
jgi:hypothetical protein